MMYHHREVVNPGTLPEWTSLRQFTNWWWRAGQPYLVPEEAVMRYRGSHEFVLFRHGQYQVEQVTLFPHHPVPAHCHPNVQTVESHIVGTGIAELEEVPGVWHQIPYECSRGHHPAVKRLLIAPGQYHRGEAHTVNVALSFQFWLHGVHPTFITDDWEGKEWGDADA